MDAPPPLQETAIAGANQTVQSTAESNDGEQREGDEEEYDDEVTNTSDLFT